MRKNMCRMVWRDMLHQIRNYKWFRKKENGEVETPMGLWVIYALFLMTISEKGWQDKKTTILYFSFIITLFLSMLFGRICPMRLPKIMYLCPMEARERRQYLRISYVTKVVISVLLSCIVEIILFALGCVTWYSALMAIFSVAMLGISINMAGGDRAFQPSDAKDRALKKSCSGYPLWLIGQQIYAIFYLIVIFVGQMSFREENMPWLLLVCCLVLSVINLVLTLRLLAFFQGTTEVLMNYELVYETDTTRRSNP